MSVHFDEIRIVGPGQERPNGSGPIREPSQNEINKGFTGYEYWGHWIGRGNAPLGHQWTRIEEWEARLWLARIRGDNQEAERTLRGES